MAIGSDGLHKNGEYLDQYSSFIPYLLNASRRSYRRAGEGCSHPMYLPTFAHANWLASLAFFYHHLLRPPAHRTPCPSHRHLQRPRPSSCASTPVRSPFRFARSDARFTNSRHPPMSPSHDQHASLARSLRLPHVLINTAIGNMTMKLLEEVRNYEKDGHKREPRIRTINAGTFVVLPFIA